MNLELVFKSFIAALDLYYFIKILTINIAKIKHFTHAA